MRRAFWLLCCCLLGVQLIWGYTVQEGCPDYMDIEGSYVEAFTGTFSDPFEKSGIVEDRHLLNTSSEPDDNTGGALKTLPAGELKSIRLGNDHVGGEAEAIVYHFRVDPNNSLLFVNFAVVMEDPGHESIYQPRFVVRIVDAEGHLVNDCSEYDVSAAAGIPGFKDYIDRMTAVRWRDWTKVGLDLTPFAGQEVQVQFVTYDCALLGHFGYAYFTASCAPNRLEVSDCGGSSVVLSAPEGFASYLWDNGDTTRTTVRSVKNEEQKIFCEVTSVTGCSFTQSALITSTNSDLQTFFVDTICQGGTYTKHGYDLPAQQNVGTTLFSNLIVDPTNCSEQLETQLQLTVLQQYYELEAAICQGEDYEENGFSILQPPVGVLFDTLRFVRRDARCDSLVCLKLNISETLNLPNTIVGDATPCTGIPVSYYVDADNSATNYLWTLPDNAVLMKGGSSPQIQVYFTDDQPGTLILTGENGCGTGGVPLEVRPRMSYHQMINDTACVGEFYDKYGFSLGKLTTTGYFSYTHSLQTTTGCDSVTVLILNVFNPPTVSIEMEEESALLCSSDRVMLQAKGSAGGYVMHGCDSLPVAVGDVYCTDGSIVRLKDYPSSGKEGEGVVFYVDLDGEYALVAYLTDSYENRYMTWQRNPYDVPSVPNFTQVRSVLYDMDGYGNTANYRREGDSRIFPIAWAVNFDEGWYLPALGELRLLFASIHEINGTLSAIGGDELPSYTNDKGSDYGFAYFSSTEHSASYFCVVTETGTIKGASKTMSYGSFRQIRSVKLNLLQKPLVKIGDVVENEYGEKGVAFHLNEDGRKGWMVALMNSDTLEYPWSTIFYDLPQLPNRSDGTYFNSYSIANADLEGKENTRLIQQEGDAMSFPAAWQADSQKGWYLPSVGQMDELYAMSPVIDSALVKAGGEDMWNVKYWTSSELDTLYAWAYDMAFGEPATMKKETGALVRLVSEFTICEPYAEILDSALSYRWNTGDETPYLEVSPAVSTTYTLTATNSEGCQAVATKQLVVTQSDSLILNEHICYGETYKDDHFEVSESGTYTQVVDNDRCQQVIVLHLTVAEKQQVTVLEDQTCQGANYAKHGFLLEASLPGVYHDTLRLQNQTGCDSMVVLNLTVSDMQHDTLYRRVCQNESFFEEGFEVVAYQSVGTHTYEKKVTSDDGCLSMRVLQLQVDSVYQRSLVDDGCQGRSYTQHGFDVTPESAGDQFYSLTLSSQTGCDSILSLRLATSPSYHTELEDTISVGMSYEKNGFVLPERTHIGVESHQQSLTVEQTGCDSTLTLHLVVVDDASSTFVPTAFTPQNANGANDSFMPGYEVFIYDRYGLLVCHSMDGWDGTYRGELADPGVYIYTLIFKSGKEKHGTIEVLKP